MHPHVIHVRALNFSEFSEFSGTPSSVQDCTGDHVPVNPRSLNARQSEDWIVVMSGKTKRVRPKVKDSHSLETDKWSKAVRFGMTKGYD